MKSVVVVESLARQLRVVPARRALAVLVAVALAGAPGAAPPARAAGAAWYDGLIQYSSITNCVSIIQGSPYAEYGAGTYVGFFANPDASQPAPNTTYYVHVVVYGLGNACSGQYVAPEIALPANTSLAITAGTPVYCFAGGASDPAECPQSLPASSVHPGAYMILSPDTAHARTWPLPQGGNWEFQVPVKSSATLSGSTLRAYVKVLDGNSSPTLEPTQGVYVFGATTPTVMYPSPSTTAIGRTTATSTANLYSAGLAGTGWFDLGTTTSYSLVHDQVAVPAGGANWQIWDDWQPAVGPSPLQPDTLYHWRARFQVTATGAWYYGADQTFRTAGAAASFVVAGIASGQAAGTVQSVTVTAKDGAGGTAAGYRGTIHFASDDGAAGLPADYTFTAGDAGTHTFASGVTMMTAGTHEVRVLDTAKTSISGVLAGIVVTSTATPPTGSMTPLATWLAKNAVPLGWGATAGTFPLASYDVRSRRAAWNGGFGPYATWRSATTGRSGSYPAVAGSTYCFSARARDTHGGVSTWTAETCTAVPLDDRSLTRSGSWTAGKGSAYYRSTYLRSTSSGAKLVRTGVVARRIALVATTCPTCGTVKVYWGTTLLRKISLKSGTTVNRKLITVTTFASTRTGKLTIKVSSSGKKVIIDGIAIRRV